MDKAENKQGKPKKEPRCDPKQLDLLKKCSEKRDVTEWNNWREKNPEVEIWLEGADLNNAYLKGAKLSDVHIEGAQLSSAYLVKADLRRVHLEGANLWRARLEGAALSDARMEETVLSAALLQGADLKYAHLERANLAYTRMEGVKLFGAYLEGAWLGSTHLRGAHLNYGYLKRAQFHGAHMERANFTASIVDGSTLFWHCTVDHKTDFRGVGLETCRIDERTKYLLEYNRRRMNCEDWYKQHPILAPFAKAFFSFSDYGNSTWRIIQTFLIMATCFAIVYYIWGAVDYYLLGVTDHPGIVTNLFVSQHGPVDFSLVLLRSIYFSIVTMTTLGFGDMYANANNYWLAATCGHLLLGLQVILGYVLLGALVTRFGVLFTSGLIPGEFKEQQKESQK